MILVGNPEGRRALGRSSGRRVDNIKTNLYVVGGREKTGSIWLRALVNAVMFLRLP
jgi:hypothetical protein